MKRCEIWTAATGHGFGSKPRPVLIIQAEEYRDSGLILTAGLTGEIENGSRLRPRVSPTAGNGLHKDSDIMVDLILPVDENKFDKFIGTLDSADMTRVENALLIILGFKN